MIFGCFEANLQQKVLVEIVKSVTGSGRMPMIILDCPCGWKGKYFEIYGRMAKAEVRGCSDNFGEKSTGME